MKTKYFSFEIIESENKIGKLIIDIENEKVNTLSLAVMEDFSDMLKYLKSTQNQISACILLSKKSQHFIAGADIKLIQSVKTEQEARDLSQKGQDLLNQWADLSFLKVAAVRGVALGGGLEFCLACDSIIACADESTVFGLPEVLLGLLPGMGGTQRLPKKIGLVKSLDLLLTGRKVSAKKAHLLGLVEKLIAPEGFEQSAVQWAIYKLSESPSRETKKKITSYIEYLSKSILLLRARQKIIRQTKGHYPAPLEILNILEKTFEHSTTKWRDHLKLQKNLKIEAEAFGRCATSEVCKNLINIFFLQESTKKPLVENELVPLLTSVGILGAGVMGGGLASLFAQKKILTYLKDINTTLLEIGLKNAKKFLEKNAKKKHLPVRKKLTQIASIVPCLKYDHLSNLNLIVEAVVENMEIKKNVLVELESNVLHKSIIASNTSALSISEMQKVLKHPERFVGMHFFNPVHKMPLVEIIAGAKTSASTVHYIYEWTKQLGKIPIVVQDQPGFLVNRLLFPYVNEAAFLVEEGVEIGRIDQLLINFGMPMGPLELMDEVGIDVGNKVGLSLEAFFGKRFEQSQIASKLLKAGRLGKKNQQGIYTYTGKQKNLSPKVLDIIEFKPGKNDLSDDQIIDRCIGVMLNEAFRILEAQVVPSAAHIDLGMIFGTGFPAFRGGLMRYGQTIGFENIVQKLDSFSKKTVVAAERFMPAQLLKNAADTKRDIFLKVS